VAVLDPLKLVIDNFPADLSEPCTAPVHPHHSERGQRHFPITRELWIERDDFTETPPKGYFRLFPGNKVRLRYGYVIECTGAEKDANGKAFHQALIEMGRVNGSGWVDYLIARPGKPKPSPKWSYVKAINVNGVPGLIGAGFYPD